jgi:mono/diheme cytochrome c family protein
MAGALIMMRRNKLLLLIASLATLLLLGAAAWQENVQREWRRIQRDLRSRLQPSAAAGFPVQLRQIVIPRLGATDRCVSCHVGMAPGEPGIPGDRVFAPHKNVVHDPADFGCVVCHGGQGRATDRQEAHGRAEFWPTPMLPREYSYAGCGACHTHLAVPGRVLLERGAALVERYDCFACHALDGRGGTLRPGEKADRAPAPDLSRAGAAGYDPGWYEKHLARTGAGEERWIGAFRPIDGEDREAIRVFLSSRVGAPGLVESKALFHSLGCRGCHKVGGVGGDDGPDLTQEGEKDPGRLDFTHVPGGRSLPAWLAEHFRAPATVVPGSAMPTLGLGEEPIRSLTFYMMSLRRSETPEAYWPKDRIRAERFGEREFSKDGATLFGTFCAACHGPSGQGMRYPGMTAFPAIGSPGFLSLASDDFIRNTVRRGRPGRRMPAWGEKEGGLLPDEIAAVAAYVRSLGGGVQPERDPLPARWVREDARAGVSLYADNCASCHGAKGEGKEGIALANPVLLSSATDTYLVETILRGRNGTSMPAFGASSTVHATIARREAESIVAFIRTWEEKTK